MTELYSRRECSTDPRVTGYPPIEAAIGVEGPVEVQAWIASGSSGDVYRVVVSRRHWTLMVDDQCSNWQGNYLPQLIFTELLIGVCSENLAFV